MDLIIWTGAGISFLGLIGLLYSMYAVLKARREGLDDDALRARLQKVLPVNMGSFFVSLLGLIIVVVGIIPK